MENIVYSPYIPTDNVPTITKDTTEEEKRSWDPEYYDFMKQYRIDHSVCPKCGGKNYTMTLVGYIFDKSRPEEYKDKNRVHCLDCGWRGMVHSLVPEKSK